MNEDDNKSTVQHEDHAAETGEPKGLTRRSFLQAGTGAVVGTAALAGASRQLVRLGAANQLGSRNGPHGEYTPHFAEVVLRLNGDERKLRIPHQRTLLLVLREDLGLTGTKKSCNLGQCGACTILLDGLPVYSCLMLAMDAADRNIITIEGLSQNGKLHPVQEGFIKYMGSQCGHCTPGMIMAGVALLGQNPQPTLDEVKAGLSGNLCRCGNYRNEIAGVLYAAGLDSAAILGAGQVIPSSDGVKAGLNSTAPTVDARSKATGEALFAGDVSFHRANAFEKTLCAKVVRSPYALADVLEIDDSAARLLPGYRGMVTFADVPGYHAKTVGNERAPARSDRLFMNGRARYVGDAVAAIAADDQYTAQRALDLISVKYRVLTPRSDAERNLREDARAIHSDGAVAGFSGPQPASKPTVEYKRGDIAKGFRESDLVVEGRYITPIQCHVPIEPHAVVAHWQGEQVTFWDSQQSIFAAQDILANALALKREQVRVIAPYVGGGFGGKCTDTLGKTLYQGITALLARKTQQPVRLEYTLKELMFAEDTRNPFIFYLRTGVTKDGTIMVMECKAIARTGGYASSGPAVVSVAGEGIVDTYRVPNYWYHGYCVYTSSPVGGEMRGFGHPQAVFARETHMDEVAEALGMDPVEFRRKNSLHTGDLIDTDVIPNVALKNIGAEQCLHAGAEAIGWNHWQHHTKKSGKIRRGLGVRFSQEHTGRNASDGLVWRHRDGKIHVPIGSGNLGTNSHTGIAVIVAKVLGVPIEQLDLSWGDTDTSVWDFVSDASRAVHCHGKAMYNAALDLKRQMASNIRRPRTDFTPYYDPKTDVNPYLDEGSGQVIKNVVPKVNPQTEAMAHKIVEQGGLVGLGFYVWNPAVESWGASFAEVEVDLETGQVDVLKLVMAHDCGRVIHRTGAEAQVMGGGIMGLGYAMTEELILDPVTGIPVTQSLYEYRPPTIVDVPEMMSILIEAPVDAGPFGAKGLGENPIFNAAAAVGNAIYNATGVRTREIPYTWPRVFAGLKERGQLA